MSPLLVLLTRIGYLHHFGIKISKIVGDTANKNMDMNEIFLKSPNVTWRYLISKKNATLETAFTHFVSACNLILFLCLPQSVKK